AACCTAGMILCRSARVRGLALTIPLFVCAVAGVTAGCNTDEGDSTDATQREINTMESTGGRYHASIGGGSIPPFIMKALEVDVDGKRVPFLSPQNTSRYGLISDPPSAENPEGLPIGMTLGRAPDTGLVSVGFNCAVCHTSELSYRVGGAQK